MPGAAMKVCEVTEGEDFAALIVTDANLSTLDAVLVACGAESDALVRFVTSDAEAEEYILLVT